MTEQAKRKHLVYKKAFAHLSVLEVISSNYSLTQHEADTLADISNALRQICDNYIAEVVAEELSRLAVPSPVQQTNEGSVS